MGVERRAHQVIAVAALLLTACEQAEYDYRIAPPPPSGESAPPTREPASARQLYEEGCTASAADAGAPDTARADAGSSDAGAATPGCTGGKVVHFVYFVESDRTYDACWHAALERHAYDFQRYWYDQLGATLYLNDPVVEVVMAEHDSSWYVRSYDGIHTDGQWFRLGNMMTEVYERLGIEQFDPDHRVVVYPTTRYDGRVGANFGGAWMDGDNITCLTTGLTYPYDEQGPAHCLGHVLHEFGHVLGLEHTGPDSDCMRFGFYTDDPEQLCSFSPDNALRVLRHPDNAGWFEAKPGDRCTGR